MKVIKLDNKNFLRLWAIWKKISSNSKECNRWCKNQPNQTTYKTKANIWTNFPIKVTVKNYIVILYQIPVIYIQITTTIIIIIWWCWVLISKILSNSRIIIWMLVITRRLWIIALTKVLAAKDSIKLIIKWIIIVIFLWLIIIKIWWNLSHKRV